MNNSVEFIGSYGGDFTHAQSAWTSTSRDMTPEKVERIERLLKEVLMGGFPAHTSPFEKSFLHFFVRSDIASHIHILKHRIGVSVNAESARYKELKDDKFYIPVDWPEDLQEALKAHNQLSNNLYHRALIKLTEVGFNRNRAKESARYFRLYSSQIDQDVSFNFLSFMHFQVLRNDPHAQVEIREIAQEMRRYVELTGMFDHSLAAFDKHYEKIKKAFE